MTTILNSDLPANTVVTDFPSVASVTHHAYLTVSSALNAGVKRIDLRTSRGRGVATATQAGAHSLGFKTPIFDAERQTHYELQQLLNYGGISEAVLIIDGYEDLSFLNLTLTESQDRMNEMVAAKSPKLLVVIHYDK